VRTHSLSLELQEVRVGYELFHPTAGAADLVFASCLGTDTPCLLVVTQREKCQFEPNYQALSLRQVPPLDQPGRDCVPGRRCEPLEPIFPTVFLTTSGIFGNALDSLYRPLEAFTAAAKIRPGVSLIAGNASLRTTEAWYQEHDGAAYRAGKRRELCGRLIVARTG
jgi:hypothetical protein